MRKLLKTLLCTAAVATLAMIGSARKVIATKDDTTIVEGAGSAAAIKARITQINQQIAARVFAKVN